jgi:malonyl CoA-acyl carrier protein transacylase
LTTAVIFPGQGSQRPGMGAGLFDRYPDLEQRASDVLGYSLRQLCLEDPHDQLRETRYTQPARYVVNALALLAACDDGTRPDVLLGHSVGEYNALLGGGAFDFETGLRLVLDRARLMASVPGGMSVVLGMDSDTIENVLSEAELTDVDLANLNAVDQVVVAGPVDKLEAAGEELKAAGAFAVKPLEVSGPFHSRYLRPAAEEFAQVLANYRLEAPRLPVIANRTAREYGADNIAQLLAEQIDHQVRWADSLEYLLLRDPRTEFIELGGGSTLGSTVRRARQHADALAPRSVAAGTGGIPR